MYFPKSKFLRLLLIFAILGGALMGIYFADTIGEAKLRLSGVVVNYRESQRQNDTRWGTDNLVSRQVQIQIPGRTFWWDASFRVGARVGVYIIDGRFTKWRYIVDVDSPRLLAFEDALEDYEDMRKLRGEVPSGPLPTRH